LELGLGLRPPSPETGVTIEAGINENNRWALSVASGRTASQMPIQCAAAGRDVAWSTWITGSE
jgi:hypothetical protein